MQVFRFCEMEIVTALLRKSRRGPPLLAIRIMEQVGLYDPRSRKNP
jgi:hypothetical protein